MEVSIVMTNRFTEFVGQYPKDKLQPYYSFYPRGYKFMPAYRMGNWDGTITLLKRNRVPTGLFLATRKLIEEELGLTFEVDRRFVKIKFKPNGITSDRDYQNECVEQMIHAAEKRGGGLVLAATGVGKTRTAGMFFSRLVGKGCFIVDELTLLKQAQNELADVLGEDVGEVGDSKFLPKRITVATSQTLHLHEADPRFQDWVESLQVNIIDEVHQAMNRRNFDIVEAIAPPAVFGLTATLQLQEKHIRVKAYALTGPVCYEYDLTKGQDEGHLAQGVVIQVLHPTIAEEDYKETDKFKKELMLNWYAQAYSELIVHNDDRNDLICDLAREAVERGYFPLVLVERIAHLKLLSELLKDIPHRVVCGEKRVEERIEAKRKFEQGKIRLLIANKVFQKGIDIKRLDVIIDAGGMKSKNRAIQVFGRGVRLFEGKEGLLHFDVSDTENLFEKAAKSRRNAFKKRGIPVKKLVSRRGAAELFDLAKEFLAENKKK